MKLFSIIGEKLSHSMSPFIHRAIFENLGLDDNYCIMEIKRENLPKLIPSLFTLGYSGVNVTIPYKEEIMPYVDKLSPEAKSIGAINTIQFENGIATGYNTDYFGFSSMLERASVDVSGKNVVLFGAGGAAKALIAYLIDNKVNSLKVVSKTKGKLIALKNQFDFISYATMENNADLQGDIAINSTPVGMYPHTEQSIIDTTVVHNFNTLIDIVYNPLETKFLKLGNEKGIKTVDGLYMLIDQAIKAQEIFQNTTIDKSIGNKIYEDLSIEFLGHPKTE